ncbi:cation-translocating P-type ATPase [Mycoplasma crocodyli]|uniref:Cation transporting P-type ATPase n=1 Tax=Mycoplasma crocodyli (strain ATCC 51981 / MP145) TaxID=512564 RepID=D5E5A6_MYCCM|nr:cation-translocating P-type ATPase [Mycoplasma crocodyli]ADE19505.1 cation transporting P-type ATPase [Mycoplasma crocodyli MP145]
MKKNNIVNNTPSYNSDLFNTNKKTGLYDDEVNKRLEKYGKNVLHSSKKINPFVSFIKQFKDFMIILLLIAAVFSVSVAIYELVRHGVEGRLNDTVISFVEPGIILLVVILNSILGAYQEIKSDQAVKALEKINETNAKVLRNGRMILIPSSMLVPGDILVIEAGDTISADAQLIESYNLMVVESSLTGESLSTEKDWAFKEKENCALGDRKSSIFSGTYVTNGRGVAIVKATGSFTEIGKINKLIKEQNVLLSPLQIKLNKLGKIFSIAGIALLIFAAIAQILLDNLISGSWTNINVYTNSLITSISLAVAAIPEGLITFTSVLLAIGVTNMTKQNAIIKSLSSVETIGSTSIICSDKTGTLTENKMVVVDMMNENEIHSKNNDINEFKFLISQSILCTDASIHLNQNDEFEEVGDPTETGLLRQGYKVNLIKEDLLKTHIKIDSLPFDSDRKMMSVLINHNEDIYMITKGAPDVILSKVKNKTKLIHEMNELWSNQSYRVLAFAIKKFSKSKKSLSFADENELEFIGLIAMIDPPRANVKSSIEEAQKAGIKTVMITGDHLTTAVAIAKSLGIYKDGDLALTGSELAQLNQKELEEKVKSISVYARVNPEDKLRIVKAWQYHDQVVAMTGDGVNDAPALKASNVGCAMGITGTDVSKQAADVILTDDNFNTIVKAIKGGRQTYDKIKTVVLNLLVSSLTEIFVMLIGLFAFRFIFFNTIGASTEFWVLSASQLLWINLLTHGLPAIALGMVDSGKDVMNRLPYNKNENIFAQGMGINLLIQSIILSLLSLGSYLVVGLIAKQNGIIGLEFVKLTSTACFITMGIAASLNSLNLMSDKSILTSSVRKYKLVYLASLFSFVCVIIAAFVPGIRNVFKMLDISTFSGNYTIYYWLIPLGLGFGLILWNEISKLFKKNAKYS